MKLKICHNLKTHNKCVKIWEIVSIIADVISRKIDQSFVLGTVGYKNYFIKQKSWPTQVLQSAIENQKAYHHVIEDNNVESSKWDS